MIEVVFLLIGLAMAAGVAFTVVRPLWKEGLHGLAVAVGALVVALAVGLVYLIGFFKM